MLLSLLDLTPVLEAADLALGPRFDLTDLGAEKRAANPLNACARGRSWCRCLPSSPT